MRPYPGIRVSQAGALFASRLQRGDEPDACHVRAAITAALQAFGRFGCAARVAQESADHPETAVIRMGWARAQVRGAFAAAVPGAGPAADAAPLLLVRARALR